MGEEEAEAGKDIASAPKTESKDLCIVLGWVVGVRNGIDARLNERLIEIIENVWTGKKSGNAKE